MRLTLEHPTPRGLHSTQVGHCVAVAMRVGPPLLDAMNAVLKDQAEARIAVDARHTARGDRAAAVGAAE